MEVVAVMRGQKTFCHPSHFAAISQCLSKKPGRRRGLLAFRFPLKILVRPFDFNTT